MTLTKSLEKKWFKKRMVYCLSVRKSDVCSKAAVPDGYSFNVVVTESKEYLKFVFKIENSLQKTDCAWTNIVLNSSANILWHDNYPLKTGEGLVFSSFVDPAFRGRKFYAILLDFIKSYFCHETPFRVEALVAVVEQGNIASRKSHEMCGYVIREKNFLIKFLGKNLFSIYSKPLRGYFVYKMRNSF